MANINMRPSGIRWEDKELLMNTGRHIRDCYGNIVDPNSERCKNALIIAQRAANTKIAFDICFTPKYISIVPVSVHFIDTGSDDNILDRYEVDYESFVAPEIDKRTICSQQTVRSVRDAGVIFNQEIRIYKNHKIAVVIEYNGTYYTTKKSLDALYETNMPAAFYNCTNFAGSLLPKMVEVHSDEEIEKHASLPTKAHRTLACVLFGSDGSDAINTDYAILAKGNNRIQEQTTYYRWGQRFAEALSNVPNASELENEIKTFLGATDEINNFEAVQEALIRHPASSTENNFSDLDWDIPEDVVNNYGNVYVRRQGDFVLFNQPSRNKRLIFNVVKKVCFKFAYNTYSPFNSQNDADLFDDSDVTFIGEKNDIFKGTIVEFLLNFQTEQPILYPAGNREPVSIDDIINHTDGKNIDLLLKILVNGKYRFYEQLATARLLNLFLWFIHAKSNRVVINDFWLSTFNERGTNLKEALGLNMGQLRVLDSLLTVRKFENAYDSENGYYFPVCNLKVFKSIGFNIDNNIDPNSFRQIMTSVIFADQPASWASRIYGDSYRNFTEIQEEIKDLTVKEKIQFIQKYVPTLDSDKLTIANDFFRMRKQLSQFSDENMDHYPAKPGKATRCITYMSGMRLADDWSGRVYNREDFVEKIQERYTNARFMENEEGQISGAIVPLTPAENMRYIHDVMSNMIALHQDEMKQREFTEAIKRVKKFEFRDEKMGLEMVAPTKIQDIKNEGEILSHCVASYVDPICNGTENIIFLRRIDHPGEPYFTVDILNRDESEGEIVDGVVRQVHCYANGDPTNEGIANAYRNSKLEVYDQPKDVLTFLQKWAKAMKIIDVKSIKANYGRLCAHGA